MAIEEHLAKLREGVDKWNEWRRKHWNEKLRPNLSGTDLQGTNLSGANFGLVDFTDANLSNSILIGSYFLRANLSNAKLMQAKCKGAYFSDAILKRTDFTNAWLFSADFSRADLTGACLENADLTAIRAIDAKFCNTKLTGACIQDWNIIVTHLDDVLCEYVYLKNEWSEQEKKYLLSDRRPSSSNFAPGEFTLLFQKALDTVDLIFADGIDWKAFFQSFQELRSQYDDNLSIQAIEKKSGDAFVIRLEVPLEADKATIERQAKELYERDRQILEAQYRERLNAKDNQIEIYKQQSASMEEIAKLLATRSIKFEEPKVTLQPTQIKILQAIQDGKGDSDSVSIAVNLSTDTVEYYLTEMNRDGYVRYFPSLGEAGGCNLTSKRRIALNDPDLLLSQRRESNVSINQTFKNDLRGSNIINFANQVRDSASQNASQFSQAIGQNADELIKLIATLRETAQTFPAEQQEEALGHLDDLQEDLSIPERQEPSRIKRPLKALVAIALTLGALVAGTADFTNNLTDLAEKLGVPIELNQSKTPPHLPSVDER